MMITFHLCKTSQNISTKFTLNTPKTKKKHNDSSLINFYDCIDSMDVFAANVSVYK